MSKLNCWPGCLAMFVRSTAGNEGRIVRCVELHPRHRKNGPTGSQVFACWDVREPVPTWDGKTTTFVPDSWLRPITPPPGTVSDTEVRELFEPSKKQIPQTAEIADSEKRSGCDLPPAPAKTGERA